MNDEWMTVIYWFIFIFYSFSGLDELIELYSVFAGREKGALGLLFEMNYFLGLFTLGVVIYATNTYVLEDFTKTTEDYSSIYYFL